MASKKTTSSKTKKTKKEAPKKATAKKAPAKKAAAKKAPAKKAPAKKAVAKKVEPKKKAVAKKVDNKKEEVGTQKPTSSTPASNFNIKFTATSSSGFEKNLIDPLLNKTTNSVDTKQAVFTFRDTPVIKIDVEEPVIAKVEDVVKDIKKVAVKRKQSLLRRIFGVKPRRKR
jgi:hypothetical protein